VRARVDSEIGKEGKGGGREGVGTCYCLYCGAAPRAAGRGLVLVGKLSPEISSFLLPSNGMAGRGFWMAAEPLVVAKTWRQRHHRERREFYVSFCRGNRFNVAITVGKYPEIFDSRHVVLEQRS